MKLRIIAVGRLGRGPERTLVDDYLKRAGPLLRRLGLAGIEERELAESRAAAPEARRRQEAEAIMRALPADSRLILLDERGDLASSRELTDRLRRLAGAGGRELAIVIGGPDGVDDALRHRADWTLALGRLTWPHRLVRVMLAEQLYRAGSIAAGHPYHRD